MRFRFLKLKKRFKRNKIEIGKPLLYRVSIKYVRLKFRKSKDCNGLISRKFSKEICFWRMERMSTGKIAMMKPQYTSCTLWPYWRHGNVADPSIDDKYGEASLNWERVNDSEEAIQLLEKVQVSASFLGGHGLWC